MTQDAHVCPIEITIEVMGGKWKPLILWYLKDGSLRFNALKKLIPAITHKMLTQHLRELEEDGVLERTVYAEMPPRVEYFFTEYGKTLLPVLLSMSHWGYKHAVLEQREVKVVNLEPAKIG